MFAFQETMLYNFLKYHIGISPASWLDGDSQARLVSVLWQA